ncbi:Protein RecA [Vibrio coralliirubri]|uniref:recombinase RecA n=1 Tax=Vibrio coralliirubri TaxID=1516159 RepID=UPI0006324C91|nr:hypothetical protein [Vibrio coralliirubri]CDT53623.1 Protein RecA [Vibrio coralliirubri]
MAKSLADALQSAIGGNDEHQQVSVWLDTGFKPLNKAISSKYDGGAPCSRIIEIFGGESCGKTAIATQIMVSAQKAGGIACFMDHERSFDVRLAKKLGLETDPNRWVFKTPRTFEQSMDNAKKIAYAIRENKFIEKDAPIVIVFDSLAGMVPMQKLDKDAEDFNMNDNTALARCTSASFPALAQICEENNMLAIFLNQIREKIGVVYGDKTSSPGGNAPRFYASVRIKLTRSQITGSDKKEKIGQRVTAECVKNKVSAPFKKVEWDFLYMPDGSGKFDVIGSSIDHLLEIGLLEQPSKGYILWDGKKYRRNQLRALALREPTVWEQIEGLMVDEE